jgi:hypothetical protein
MYLDFTAGGNDYKLRLNTRDIVALEKRLGCNPMAIFGDGRTIPTVTVMVTILHAAMQSFNHNVTLDKAYDIFDEWLADGHTMTEFLVVIVDIYKVSGIIPEEVTEKN